MIRGPRTHWDKKQRYVTEFANVRRCRGAMSAAVMGAQAFKFESSSPFLVKHHSQVALVKLLQQERYAAFDARDFRIVVPDN